LLLRKSRLTPVPYFSIKGSRCKIRRATARPLIIPLPNREQIIENQKTREVAHRSRNAFGHFVISENKPVPVLQVRYSRGIIKAA